MNLSKIKLIKKPGCLLVLISITLIIILTIYSIQPESPSLSEVQINELRSQYPLYESNPASIQMKEPKIEEVYSISDTVILGEVVEVLPEYTIELVQGSDTPEGKIYEKWKAYGITNFASFLQYRVKISEDITGNNFDNNEDIGKDIIIAVNSQLKGDVPELLPGMKIITPIKKGKDKHEGKYFFSKYGFYYVTDDGYVLSAFAEDSKNNFTGKTLDFLKSKIKEMFDKKS